MARAPLQLHQALGAWQTPAFQIVLKDEIAGLDPALLPLQQGLSQSSHAVLDKPPGVTILAVEDAPDHICVRVGLIYSGIIAGCSCADDPTPIDEIAEYCEVRIEIDKRTAEAGIALIEG